MPTTRLLIFIYSALCLRCIILVYERPIDMLFLICLTLSREQTTINQIMNIYSDYKVTSNKVTDIIIDDDGYLNTI